MCVLTAERRDLPGTGSKLKERRHESVQSTIKDFTIGKLQYRFAVAKEHKKCP